MKSAPVVIAALLASVTAFKLGDYDLDDTNNALVTSNSDLNEDDTRSLNDYDAEAKTPEQMTVFAQKERNIIDADGDGVEDNQHKSQEELDRFRARVFGTDIEDMHNTRNGQYPGHVRADDHPMPTEAPRPDYPSLASQTASDAAVKALDAGIGSSANVEVSAENLNAVHQGLTKAFDTSAKKENADMSPESLGQIAEGIDIADSYGDAEYLQTAASQQSANKLGYYVQNIGGPEDLELLQVSKTRKAWRRRMTDMDGDGVEDNVKFSHDTLDEFYDPLVFGVAEDLHNTHHGNLPGHRQLEFTLNNGEPAGLHWQTVVQDKWATK